MRGQENIFNYKVLTAPLAAEDYRSLKPKRQRSEVTGHRSLGQK